MTFETDLTYPHGKLATKTLHGIDGYLLTLQYKNPASLGKALSALGGEIYWLRPENDRAVVWLSEDAVKKVSHQFSERLSYLAQFEVAETKRICDRCKNHDVLYAGGKYGYPVRLLCFECSRLASATSDRALAAREEAEKFEECIDSVSAYSQTEKGGLGMRIECLDLLSKIGRFLHIRSRVARGIATCQKLGIARKFSVVLY